MKQFKIKQIVQMMLLPLGLMPTVTTLHASDLEIYQGNQQGKAVIMMMLDTSGSMGTQSILDDYTNGVRCAFQTENQSVTFNGSAYTYGNSYCTVNGTKYYDRISRLKQALMKSFSDNSIKNDVLIGLGQFSSVIDDNATGLNNGAGAVDGISGRITVPAAPLNAAQRVKILNSVKALKPNGGTPTAAAYAEVGAYMLSTVAGGVANDVLARDALAIQNKGGKEVTNPSTGYKDFSGGTNLYFKCTDWLAKNLDDYEKDKNGNYVRDNKGNPKVNAGTPPGDKYLDKTGKNKTYTQQCTGSNWKNYTFEQLQALPVGGKVGGWIKLNDFEDLDTLDAPNGPYDYGNYNGLFFVQNAPDAIRPVNLNASSGFTYSVSGAKNNNGNGYSSPLATTDTCNGNGIYFLTDGYPNGVPTTTAQTIMTQSLTKIGAATPTSSISCSSNLPDTESGSSWRCIGQYSQALFDKSKNPMNANIKTAVVGFGTLFADTVTNGKIDCSKTSNQNVKNACLWGNSSDYGQGGFYYANNTADLTNSLNAFVGSITPDFKPTSLGTISIPRDPLDATKAMNTGFFPMIQPITDTSRRSWLGNLKKYYVLNGTLKDSETGGNNLYNTDQTINPNAKDIWSDTTGDNSSITVGGTLNKIPVPANFSTTQNPVNNTDSSRNVFAINDSGALVRVTKTNLATDYTTAANGIPVLGIANIKQRYALLNYLGYQIAIPGTLPATFPKTEIDKTTIPANPYRFLAGVVHSTPLVVTKQAVVSSSISGGMVTESAARTKTEYVVYGSMDGGLHIVDAATGVEKSVFVPKEILDNQPETLASTEATGTIPSGAASALAYGVDAPWTADNTFKSTSSKTGNTTTTTYTATAMNIYGGLRMGGRALYGLDISTPTAPALKFRLTSNSSGFSRLGQIWSKPVIAYVRYNKVRTKVLIFGGGYDDAYETTYKTSSPTGNTTTLGNAVYIVKADDGTLLWSGSSDPTSGKNLQNTDMKYSIVGQPAVRDYNTDGLIDAIWVADLGGQVFRIDLNNAIQNSTTFSAVRAPTTLARLSTTSPAFTPRFYERPSTAVFDEGQNRFILVSVGSGNRSFPLQKEAGLNKVYGLIDKDATANALETSSYTTSSTITSDALATSGVLGKPATGTNNPTAQISATDVTSIKNYVKSASSGTKLKGWAFSLKGVNTATETGAATDGYVKAFEEPQLLSGNLYYSIYDPNASATGSAASSCTGGVRGLSTVYRICAPYGDCAAFSVKDSTGIIGVPVGPLDKDNPRKIRIVTPDPTDDEKCIGTCGAANNTTLQSGKGQLFTQGRSIRPIRWYEW